MAENLWGTHLPGAILGKIYGYVGRSVCVTARRTCTMWSRMKAWLEEYKISQFGVCQELGWLRLDVLRVLRLSYGVRHYVVTCADMEMICKLKRLEKIGD